MQYTEKELEIAFEWHESAKFRSDIIADVGSFIEGMRYASKNCCYNQL
jgi:hypothetical protein